MENKINILYAEDDLLGATLTRAILEKHNFRVEIAPDGEEAWKAYKRKKPDILLLNLDMPGINGLQLTQLVRKQDLQTFIIVYSLHGEAEKEIAILDAGADEFICKERPPEILVAYLKRISQKIMTNLNTPHLYQLSPRTTYNSSARTLTIDGESTSLKTIDARFLQLLCAKNQEVASREYLIEGVWGQANLGKASELKKYASRVRKLLKVDSSLKIEYRENGYILITEL